jgi:hypothetical protein
MGPGQLFESGGQSHVSIDWTPSSLEMVDQRRSGGSIIKRADEMERLVDLGRWDEARGLLLADVAMTATYKRRLLAKLLRQAEAWPDLKNLLRRPENDEELAMYAMAAERSGDMAGVDEVLSTGEASGEFNAQLIAELQQRVWARSRLER